MNTMHRSDSSIDKSFDFSFSGPPQGHSGSDGGAAKPGMLRRMSSSLATRRSKKVLEVKLDPFRAAHEGDVDLLRRLLDRDESSVSKTRWSGWTLLHRAAEAGQTDICEVLIQEYEADVNARTTRGWHTPLHLSLGNGFLETSMLLIKCGGDLSLMNKDRHTPIVHASLRGYNLVAAELEHEMFQRQMRSLAAATKDQGGQSSQHLGKTTSDIN